MVTSIAAVEPYGILLSSIPPEIANNVTQVDPSVIEKIYESLVAVPTPTPAYSLCNSWVVKGCISLGDPRIALLQMVCITGVFGIGVMIHLIATTGRKP
jgi:hypothetical protein